MSSAMVALGQTIGREVRIGRSEFVAVHAAQGLFLPRSSMNASMKC